MSGWYAFALVAGFALLVLGVFVGIGVQALREYEQEIERTRFLARDE